MRQCQSHGASHLYFQQKAKTERRGIPPLSAMRGGPGAGGAGGRGGDGDPAIRKRTRRPRPYNTRDLMEGGPTSSERRRQVSAVLDRPDERRNPTRYLPDYS
ncbi:hypothetical protein VYU27_010236, partial [Nannochloropsis oceanica]